MIDSKIFSSTSISGIARREAVIYARVSSRDQERGGFSIPAQRKLLRCYARDNEIAITAEFTDVETAGRAGRSEFGAMVRYLRKYPSCTAILVEKTDRLYRNLKDWVMLDELGVEIHLVKEGVVLSEASVSSEKFVHGIKVLMAKNYIDNLSEETRKGMLEKARQGLWPSRAPIGYLNVMRSDGKRVIEPDPELGPLVAKVFEWYEAGCCALTELTEKARTAGLAYRHSRKPLPRSKIHALLRNPVYMGDFVWAGERYKGIHDPLVARVTWDCVQETLSSRARRRRRRRRHQFAFSGLIRCGVCADEGKRFLLVAEIKKERYVYYHCEECKRRRRATYVREEKIVEAYVNVLAMAHPDLHVLAEAAAALRGDVALDAGSDSDQRELAGLQAELDEIQSRMDMAYDDRLAGRIDADYFHCRSREWRSRMDFLRRRIADCEAAMRQTRTERDGALELGQLLEIFQKTAEPAQRRRFIETLHSNSFWKGDALSVEWRKPHEIAAEFQEAI
jgi:site-specific DNA recombinase